MTECGAMHHVIGCRSLQWQVQGSVIDLLTFTFQNTAGGANEDIVTGVCLVSAFHFVIFCNNFLWNWNKLTVGSHSYSLECLRCLTVPTLTFIPLSYSKPNNELMIVVCLWLWLCSYYALLMIEIESEIMWMWCQKNVEKDKIAAGSWGLPGLFLRLR